MAIIKRLKALRAGSKKAMRPAPEMPIQHELLKRRVSFDAKPLVPHITLARPRRRAGRLAFLPADLRDAPPLRANALTLFQSHLLPDGPKYTSLMKIRLGGP